MLILTRRAGETLRIGDNVEVTVMAINGSQVRIGIKAPRGRRNTHQFQQFERPRPRRLATAAGVPAYGLTDLLADRVDWVERGHRLLKDHRNQPAAQVAQLVSPHRQHVTAIDPDPALDVRLPR